MKYRYSGTGFVIEVREDETVDQAVKRLLAEQKNHDRPTMQLLLAQVRVVHALNALDREGQVHVASVLREMVRMTHGLQESA